MSLTNVRVGTMLGSEPILTPGKKIAASVIKAAIAGTISGIAASYLGVTGIEGAGKIPTALGSYTPVMAIGGTVAFSMLATDLLDEFVLAGSNKSYLSNMLGNAMEPVIAGAATIAVGWALLPPATMGTYAKLGLLGAGSIVLSDYGYTSFIEPAMR